MPYCLNCKDGFSEDSTICSNCNVLLAKKLPEEVKQEDADYMDDYEEYSDIMDYEEYTEFMEHINADTPALLCSVSSNAEAVVLESLLRSNNIPVMTKWRNGGDALMIYMAMSSMGADLYVPSKLLDEAMGLLSDNSDNIDEIDPEEEFLKYAKQKKFEISIIARKLFALLILLPIATTLIIILLYYILRPIVIALIVILLYISNSL